MKYYEQYLDYIYNIIENETVHFDAVYEDRIKELVGLCGFNALYGSGLLEGCGVIHGRYLFALCKKKPFKESKDYEDLKAENEKLKKLILERF